MPHFVIPFLRDDGFADFNVLGVEGEVDYTAAPFTRTAFPNIPESFAIGKVVGMFRMTPPDGARLPRVRLGVLDLSDRHYAGLYYLSDMVRPIFVDQQTRVAWNMNFVGVVIRHCICSDYSGSGDLRDLWGSSTVMVEIATCGLVVVLPVESLAAAGYCAFPRIERPVKILTIEEQRVTPNVLKRMTRYKLVPGASHSGDNSYAYATPSQPFVRNGYNFIRQWFARRQSTRNPDLCARIWSDDRQPIRPAQTPISAPTITDVGHARPVVRAGTREQSHEQIPVPTYPPGQPILTPRPRRQATSVSIPPPPDWTTIASVHTDAGNQAANTAALNQTSLSDSDLERCFRELRSARTVQHDEFTWHPLTQSCDQVPVITPTPSNPSSQES